MLKMFSRLQLAGIVISVLWFAGFSVIAATDWNRREAQRSDLYQQCLRETPDVAECKSLSQATQHEAFNDVAVDFLVTAIAPIAVLWLALWLVQRRSRSATGS